MVDKILLNTESYSFTETDLPCLITYGEKMGGSHLSITLVAQLFSQGSKILFLTAYPMARENFLEQIGEDQSRITFVNSVSDLQESLTAPVILLESGNESLFLEAVKRISNIREYVILVKNIEKFNSDVFDAILDFKKIILSGNIDECVAKEAIAKKKFETIIAFNQPDTSIPLVVPQLEKWTAYLSSSSKNGVVNLKKD